MVVNFRTTVFPPGCTVKTRLAKRLILAESNRETRLKPFRFSARRFMKLAWGDAVFAGSSQSGPNQGGAVTKPVLFGMGTACLVILLLVLAGDWYRQHLWLLWTPRELWLFYLVIFLIAVVPGGLVGLLVDRQLRLDTLLAGKTAEIAATRCDLAQTNRNLLALIAVNHELIRATDESSLFQPFARSWRTRPDTAWSGWP